MQRFFIFQAVILLSFTCGYLLNKKRPESQSFIGKIISLNLNVFEPLLGLWSIWAMDLSLKLFFMPLAGFVIVFISFTIGLIIAARLYTQKVRKLTFVFSSAITNHGFTMGAFICYIFLGESGLALALIFLLYFPFFVFGFIFTYAGLMANGEKASLASIAGHLFKGHNLPLLAAISALILNISGVERPALSLNLDIILLPAVGLYFCMLGLSFRFRNLKSCVRESVILSLLKFVLAPLLTIAFIHFVPLPELYKNVLVIESFMPAGVYSVVVANLYKLDVPLASGLFVGNTALFLVLFPFLSYLWSVLLL